MDVDKSMQSISGGDGEEEEEEDNDKNDKNDEEGNEKDTEGEKQEEEAEDEEKDKNEEHEKEEEEKQQEDDGADEEVGEEEEEDGVGGKKGNEVEDDGGTGGHASTENTNGNGCRVRCTISRGAQGSNDDEVSLTMILKRIKRNAKEQQQPEQRRSAESTRESGESFFQSSFVMKDMRKEAYEVDTRPSITLADVMKIGESRNQKKDVMPEPRDIPLLSMPVLPIEKKNCGMEMVLEMLGGGFKQPKEKES
ncbi:hypothetical protein ZWY2020_007836 [Hordeum vulgare]|nr:hypothetical protein ZWY2020_007836 [Hordeum vulgare]